MANIIPGAFDVKIDGVTVTDAATAHRAIEQRLPGHTLKTVIENILNFGKPTVIFQDGESNTYCFGVDDDEYWESYHIDLLLVRGDGGVLCAALSK